jgi:hypothetical protein
MNDPPKFYIFDKSIFPYDVSASSFLYDAELAIKA